MYSKKKILRYLLLVAALLILVIIVVSSLGDVTKIWDILTTNSKPIWLLATLGVLLVYCFFNQLSLIMLTKRKYKDVSTLDLYFISGSEFFFNAITPFSSGGQPFQAYCLKNKGVKYSDSTSILLLNFLAYQIVMNVISLVGVILFSGKMINDVPNFGFLVFIGFGINIIIMIFLILIGSTKFMGKLIINIMKLFAKIKFLRKFLESKQESFKIYVEEMQSAFKDISKDLFSWFAAVISKVIALLVYYAIPFFAFLAVGIDLGVENFIYVLMMTSFALTIAVWVPTPGSSGGAELAFTTLFLNLSGINGDKDIALSGMLVWRLFTYYLMILYGFIMYIGYTRRNKVKEIEKETTNEDVKDVISNDEVVEDNKIDDIDESSTE